MSKFDPQDWLFAAAYRSMATEQSLPYAIQLRRAKSLCAFYRHHVRHLIFHYRLWLADAEYMRITGQARTPRSNPMFAATIRRALGHYRQQQTVLRDLRNQQRAAGADSPKPDFSQMSEREIYDHLEQTHGVYFAQQVLDEMNKVRERATPRNKKAA